MNSSDNFVKRKCPYMEKCYRKNPIHFKEMSHPHLEKLVVHQLDGIISVPEDLNFECDDRSQLLDQLKVLQMVMRKERDKNENNTSGLSKGEHSKGDKTESQERKRDSKNISDDLNTTKKMKTTDSIKNSNIVADNSTSRSCSNSTLEGVSIMDAYERCKNEKSRNELRNKAIEIMKKRGFKVSVAKPGEFSMKYALSAPYHLFFSRIQNCKDTHSQQYSITFPEILDVSLGEIVSSFHINFIVDVGWLCLQYLLAGQCTDMTILYGERADETKVNQNITMIPVLMPTNYGCHHTKIMILKYKDNGLRIIVSTANLYSDDWENRTQGIWISPHLPPLSESANTVDGESPTGFKKDFVRYLRSYRQTAIMEWICAIEKADLSSINVFFLASIPGSHKDAESYYWGHRKLATILSKHATLPPDAPQWPVVVQCSSIGSLGPNYESWLLKEIVSSMSMETSKGLKSHPKFQFIYPTIDNYKESFDCQDASCCFPYSIQTHSKQEWIESYMYQWKAGRTVRNKAMPHIKSYTRLSPDFKTIPWFVLTSANLSKAAWGTFRKSHYIMNYEAGVIFLPKFITKETTFPIKEEENLGVTVFPIPYDFPPTRYRTKDKPFLIEYLEGKLQ